MPNTTEATADQSLPAAWGCGTRPRRLAIGIAPLGVVSIGVVPMGVVSIGVVPMGVVTIGAVGMGLVNLCLVGMGVVVAGVSVMGVWWAGLEGMGLHRIGGAVAVRPHASGHGHGHGSPAKGEEVTNFLYPTRAQALRKARELGCSGAHAMGSQWMPCDVHSQGPDAGP